MNHDCVPELHRHPETREHNYLWSLPIKIFSKDQSTADFLDANIRELDETLTGYSRGRLKNTSDVFHCGEQSLKTLQEIRQALSTTQVA